MARLASQTYQAHFTYLGSTHFSTCGCLSQPLSCPLLNFSWMWPCTTYPSVVAPPNVMNAPIQILLLSSTNFNTHLCLQPDLTCSIPQLLTPPFPTCRCAHRSIPTFQTPSLVPSITGPINLSQSIQDILAAEGIIM